MKATPIMLRDLDASEKPRERLYRQGVSGLTNEELIALLLGNGTQGVSVLDVARTLLTQTGGLSRLGRLSPTDLKAVRGIGRAKAAVLLAAIELGRRLSEHVETRCAVSHSGKVYDYLKNALRDLPQETFGVLVLNTKNEIMHRQQVALGTLDGATVHPRDVFRVAIHHGGFSVIVYHNHPSGNPTPSPPDIELTDRLVAAGKILGIPVLDHLVVGHPGYYSFKDNNQL